MKNPKNIQDIMREFDESKMIRIGKDAQDFNQAQYDFMMKLFREHLKSSLQDFWQAIRLEKRELHDNEDEENCIICALHKQVNQAISDQEERVSKFFEEK
jgi:phage-related tail protein